MTLREAVWAAIEHCQKLVALEAFPNARDPKNAVAELVKIFGPHADRGDSVFAAFEAALRFGDREQLAAYFDGRLKCDARAMLGVVDRAIGAQLGLFDAQVRSLEEWKRIRDQLAEVAARARADEKARG